MSISSIPEESIMEDILLRLDVKSVSLCKCVCRNWLQLIHNPNFIYKHLNLSNNPRIMLTKYDEEYVFSLFYTTIDLDEIRNSLKSSSAAETYVCDEPIAIEYFPIRDPTVEVTGSCDGLICLSTSNAYFDEEEITLWNPITREHKKLPKIVDPCYHPHFYEFWYDYKSDDYKVVRVNNYISAGTDLYGTDFKVYSLKSDSWKHIQSAQCFRAIVEHGVIVNEVLHLLGRYGGGDLIIISLDISNETIKELQLMEGILIHPRGNTAAEGYNVGVLGGCLCLLCVKKGVCADVWVMQEYGIKESWMKRFTITQVDIITSRFLNLVWDFEDGTILLSTADDSLFCYDSKQGIGRKLTICGDKKFIGPKAFVPSLISPNSSTFVQRRMS